MAGANLKGACLDSSQMNGVNLRLASLKGASMKLCGLRFADMAGTDLEVCFNSVFVCPVRLLRYLDDTMISHNFPQHSILFTSHTGRC